MKMCYNHMFIYTEFTISNVFFKERRSKYKPAYLSIRNVFYMFMFIPRGQLVLDVWLKVLEMHCEPRVDTQRLS